MATLPQNISDLAAAVQTAFDDATQANMDLSTSLNAQTLAQQNAATAIKNATDDVAAKSAAFDQKAKALDDAKAALAAAIPTDWPTPTKPTTP